MPAVIALALSVLFAAPDGRFEEGLSLFRQAAEARSPEGFRRAAEVFESMAAEGVADARLLVNIGNARAFAGDAGEAVLAYRRALVVDPSDRSAGTGGRGGFGPRAGALLLARFAVDGRPAGAFRRALARRLRPPPPESREE
ncbi:MAG: hypothetical protein MUE73_17295 [Planctomycetes bacterium]|nr:hypothetical protein [Planctomycetota bacterium]